MVSHEGVRFSVGRMLQVFPRCTSPPRNRRDRFLGESTYTGSDPIHTNNNVGISSVDMVDVNAVKRRVEIFSLPQASMS